MTRDLDNLYEFLNYNLIVANIKKIIFFTWNEKNDCNYKPLANGSINIKNNLKIGENLMIKMKEHLP